MVATSPSPAGATIGERCESVCGSLTKPGERNRKGLRPGHCAALSSSPPLLRSPHSCCLRSWLNTRHRLHLELPTGRFSRHHPPRPIPGRDCLRCRARRVLSVRPSVSTMISRTSTNLQRINGMGRNGYLKLCPRWECKYLDCRVSRACPPPSAQPSASLRTQLETKDLLLESGMALFGHYNNYHSLQLLARGSC
jgi:hypothetical protein